MRLDMIDFLGSVGVVLGIGLAVVGLARRWSTRFRSVVATLLDGSIRGSRNRNPVDIPPESEFRAPVEPPDSRQRNAEPSGIRPLMATEADWRKEAPTEAQATRLWQIEFRIRRQFADSRDFYRFCRSQYRSGSGYTKGHLSDRIAAALGTQPPQPISGVQTWGQGNREHPQEKR